MHVASSLDAKDYDDIIPQRQGAVRGMVKLNTHAIWNDLQETRARVEGIGDFTERCASHFYTLLFAEIPGVRDLFGDETKQQKMFGLMLDLILRDCENPDQLNKLLSDLGDRHLEGGIQPMHFAQAREIFLMAIKRTDPEMQTRHLNAFATVFDMIESAMLRSLKKA